MDLDEHDRFKKIAYQNSIFLAGTQPDKFSLVACLIKTFCTKPTIEFSTSLQEGIAK